MLPHDTSPEAAAMQHAVYARMTGAERLRVASELSEAARELALAGLRKRMGDVGEEELMRALVKLLYGVELPEGTER